MPKPKRKKKSLVGWIGKNWAMDYQQNVVWHFNILKNKNQWSNFKHGGVVRVRITIEEISNAKT